MRKGNSVGHAKEIRISIQFPITNTVVIFTKAIDQDLDLGHMRLM